MNFNDDKLLVATLSQDPTNIDFTEIIEVERGLGNYIADFRPLPKYRIMVLTSNGYLNLIEYADHRGNPKHPILLNWHRLTKDRGNDIELPQERFLTLILCPRNSYMAVSSSRGESDSISRIFFLEFFRSEEIIERDFYELKSHLRDHSGFRGMAFLGYFHMFPLLVAIEGYGEGSLWAFLYDGARLSEFFEKRPGYHQSDTHRMVKIEGKIWSLDAAGNLKSFWLSTY